MAKKPAPATAHEPEPGPADQAFGAARACVEHLAVVAQRAREYRPHPDKPDAWQDVAFNFAEAFIAWYDLTHLLTPAVRTEARRVYPPGAASIKLGATPYPTVIEAVADELGVYFRNAVYTGRRHPLEPDLDRLIGEAKARATARQVAQGKPAEPMGWGADLDELRAKETRAVMQERLGIKTCGDGQDLMMREWNDQGRARGESALWLLRCDSIDFDDLKTQLDREAQAVLAAENKPSPPPPPSPPNPPKSRRGLQRLAATTDTDLKVIADLKSGMSYRDAAKRNAVSKSTVERIARAYDLTGHSPESVPLGGTLGENLNIHGRPRKSGNTRGK